MHNSNKENLQPIALFVTACINVVKCYWPVFQTGSVY